MELKFKVSGMTCAACSARVEKVTGQVSGVQKVEVNLLAGRMRVEAVDASVSDAIMKAVQDAGYIASVEGKEPPVKISDNGLREMKIRIIGSGVFLVVLMYFTMGHMIGLPLPSWYHGIENALIAALLQFFLTLPAVFLNRSYFTRGIKALFHRAPNMDSLIAVGLRCIAGLWRCCAVSYGVCHGSWELGYGKAVQRKFVF